MFDIDLLNYFTESQNRYNFMITRPDAESFSYPITEKKGIFNVYGLYHGCCWLVDAKSQDISDNVADLIGPEWCRHRKESYRLRL